MGDVGVGINQDNPEDIIYETTNITSKISFLSK